MSKKKVWSRFDSKKDPEEDAFDKAEDLVTEYEGEDPSSYPGNPEQFSISGYDYGRGVDNS